MFRRNYLLNLCGVILVAISFGVLLSSDEANAQNAIALFQFTKVLSHFRESKPKPSKFFDKK